MQKTIWTTSVLLAALLCADGCGRKPAAAPAANDSAANEAVNAIAEDTTPPSNADEEALAEAANDAAAANVVVRKPGEPLSFYVGHYPSEVLGGMDFRDDPLVKRAVTEAVPDRQIRDFVLNFSDGESPIKLKDGKILAGGCQPHDCGAHHWTISIAPDGGDLEVCYFNSENPETGIAKHFFRGRKMVEKHGNCPSPASESHRLVRLSALALSHRSIGVGRKR
jgi:hypothetical protein